MSDVTAQDREAAAKLLNHINVEIKQTEDCVMWKFPPEETDRIAAALAAARAEGREQGLREVRELIGKIPMRPQEGRALAAALFSLAAPKEPK